MLKNKPSPTPVTARPAISIAIDTEPASSEAPVPKIMAPMIIAYTRPSLSAREPARKEAIAAGIKIVDTTSPCIVEDMDPSDLAKEGMVVIGPIVPVSRLERVRTVIDSSELYQPE